MHLIGQATPPTQTLFGEGLVFHYNPDTADRWPVTFLQRRCRKLSVSAKVAGPVVTVVYECRCDGDVYRLEVDDDGAQSSDPKHVPEGHEEWWWAHNALLAIRERLCYPRSEWKYAIPPDCVAWGRRKSSGTRDMKNPIEQKRHW